MSRLVVVSNRVPPPADQSANAGGLAVALKVALAERGGLWFGWSGETAAEPAPSPKVRREDNITFLLVDLTERDLDEYYNGFANRALWPLLHYRLDLTDFDRQDMSGYYRVNAYFAKLLAPQIRRDDTIWVQDYHLIPLAAELRALGLRNRIGFFLHIPFPPPDVFFAIPSREKLMRAFTAYDLVGFQTDYDVENFASCLRRAEIGTQIGADRFEAPGRRFRIGHFPIGIETRAFAELAARAVSHPLVRRMIVSLEDRKLIMGVDRLDYSKGIGQRIAAFERFIENCPRYRRNVTYLQVTPKSRSEVPEYAKMQREVAEMAGRVNGALGEIDWIPVRYLNRTIRRSTLAGLYRMSNVGLITPLRDGMNLVAKEFVAAQDGNDPGVLVLSCFAGAARELEGSLLVNPYDVEETAAAIARALAMPRDQRIARWRDMFAQLDENDVDHWCESFLAALAGEETRPPRLVEPLLARPGAALAS